MVDLPVGTAPQHPVSNAPNSNADPANRIIGPHGETHRHIEHVCATGTDDRLGLSVRPILCAVEHQHPLAAADATTFHGSLRAVSTEPEGLAAAAGAHRFDNPSHQIPACSKLFQVSGEISGRLSAPPLSTRVYGHRNNFPRPGSGEPRSETRVEQRTIPQGLSVQAQVSMVAQKKGGVVCADVRSAELACPCVHQSRHWSVSAPGSIPCRRSSASTSIPAWVSA